MYSIEIIDVNRKECTIRINDDRGKEVDIVSLGPDELVDFIKIKKIAIPIDKKTAEKFEILKVSKRVKRGLLDRLLDRS